MSRAKRNDEICVTLASFYLKKRRNLVLIERFKFSDDLT